VEHGDGAAAIGIAKPLRRWLVKRGHAKTNPLAEMELPRKRRPLPRVVDWEILAAAARAEPERAKSYPCWIIRHVPSAHPAA